MPKPRRNARCEVTQEQPQGPAASVGKQRAGKRTSHSFALVVHECGKGATRLRYLCGKDPKPNDIIVNALGSWIARTWDVMMKPVIAAALFLLPAITPAIAQPADVSLRFDCSAFTHIVWACLPPSNARDSAEAMASAFMSEAIRLGRERHISDGELNAVAIAALQRQRAKTGNTCSRLDVLVRSYGKLCDRLIDANKLLTKPTEVRTSGPR
jgi:hypothetical protein